MEPQAQDIVVPLPPITIPTPGATFEPLGHGIHQDRDKNAIDPTDPVIPFGNPRVPAVPVHTGPVKVCVDL